MNPESAARVDAVCDAFEGEWRAGREPDVAASVQSMDAELRNFVAQQIMLVDMEYRRAKYGVAPSFEEYATRMRMRLPDLVAEMDTLDGAGDLHDTPAERVGLRGNRIDGKSRPKDRSGYTLGREAGHAEIGPRIPGYELLSELGRGGMGVVYKARQIRAERLVAVKTIHAPNMASHEHVKRFQAESIAAARLTHPGIVPVFEVGEFNGVHFFSMAWIDGPNLESMAREQVLSSRAAAEICRELANALEYAHQQGVIHRDIKPLNILMGLDGQPRLTDFGLARLKDQDQSLTSTGQIIGTATYMPPENATGSDADAKATTDIYSLGATLYRCVTGRPPFQAATTMEVLRQVTNDEPVSPRRLNREIDVDIETLCLKCLEKEPSRRFQTAGELSAELTRYLNREPIHSRPISPVWRAWRWCRRRPAIATSVVMFASLIMAISIGLPYVLWHRNQLQEAQLKTEHDARLIEQSEAARQLEQVSRVQAEHLAAANAARAATQEYFVSIMKVRELKMQPEPTAGWTWEALDLLEKAATSNADGKDPIVLRSLIADIMMTPDMREIGRIEVPATKSLAVSHDGKLLAAGDWAGSPSQVRIYRIHTTSSDENQQSVQFELIRVCSVSTITDNLQSELIEMGVMSGTINREGMWALDFSPDDTKIAVGTRNGNITIWKIDCEAPQILFDKRYPEKETARLLYSMDGRQIIVDYQDPATLRVFDVATQSDRVTTFNEHVDFGLLPCGRILASRDGFISRISASSFAESVEFTQNARYTHIGTDSARSVAVVGTVPAALWDPITGEKTLTLHQSASDADRVYDLTLVADTTLALATHEPQNLRLWDALSGRQVLDISYPGNERPLICAGRERDRVYVHSIINTFAYQLRCSQPVLDNSEASPHAQADLSQIDLQKQQTHAESSRSLANAVLPAAAFAPGAQVLSTFALSHDQQQMAVVEAASVRNLQAIPDGYRARLRKLNTSDGEETARWTCLLLGSGEHRNTLTEGEAATFLDDDAVNDGSKIAFTTPAVGNIAVVSEAGFYFPSGAGLDVQQSDPIIAAANTASWTGGEVSSVLESSGFRPAIELKLPRGLTQSRERLLIRLNVGETVRHYEISDRHLDSAGWYLIFLDQFTEALAPGTWRIEATLVESDLRFDSNPGNADTANESAIQVGHLFLMPWKRLSRGKTRPVYPLRLGPLARRFDNGLAAVVESWTLYQWGSDLCDVASTPWQDVLNSKEDIGSVCASQHGCLVGTDSGLVAIVKPDGSQDLIEAAHTEKGAYDSRDGVLATAVADEVGLAIAGTLRGQIKVYELQKSTGAPVAITDAHDREIVALAITDDGQLIASTAADGSLRFWKRHTDALELLFEMTSQKSVVRQLMFSKNGQSLYVLREGERGIRRIELAAISSMFRQVGLELP